jgi:hypothetical protein
MFTDYPIEFLGDKPGEKAPVRPVAPIGWDNDKYVKVRCNDCTVDIKIGYIYSQEGRYGEVPGITLQELEDELTRQYQHLS